MVIPIERKWRWGYLSPHLFLYFFYPVKYNDRNIIFLKTMIGRSNPFDAARDGMSLAVSIPWFRKDEMHP